ncbi:MAG: rod shape-determining protein RodA, partial [Deltaproteobacteria bacterium]
NVAAVPTGFRKIFAFNWALALVVTAVAVVGVTMLYSVAGGNASQWAEPTMKRFIAGFILMFGIAMVPIWFWRNMSGVFYLGSLALLVAVDVAGHTAMGAERWINLGFIRLQPSELMKVALVMLLAAYYDWLDPKRISHPLWVAVPVIMILAPTALVILQPDLGTALLLLFGGAIVMFAAGVSLWYFGAVALAGASALVAVFASRGQAWQILHDYQYKRIDVFLDPSLDPLKAGYHITQAKIALGSGGWFGKGFMQGTQTRLDFLPEKHTDFIFTTLAEQFGFVGGISLLVLYGLILIIGLISAMTNKDRFGSLVTIGIIGTFFLLFAVNMSMVMGLAPVVGVPLPMVSWGGTAMIILMCGFGLVQSAHVHRPRTKS